MSLAADGLFTLQNGKVIPSIHALMIEPYKSMWARDPTPEHEHAMKAFHYAELMCSPKKSNPFSGVDERIRSARVKYEVWRDENYQPDFYTITDMIEMVRAYKEHLEMAAPGYSLYVTAQNTAERLRVFLEGFDFNERNKSGMLILKPKEVTSALVEVRAVIKSLNGSRDEMLTELTDKATTRKQREIGPYER